MEAANWLRKLLPRTVKARVKSVLGMQQSRMHPDWRLIEKVGRVEKKHLVLDIGARNGWFLQCWLDWLPQAEIIAFEPEPGAFEQLSERYRDDKRVRIEPFGIAEKKEQKSFYVLKESLVSSSLLEPDQAVWDEIKYKTGEVDTITIETITLDDFIDTGDIEAIHFIKMDIQGYELRALQGAVNTLKKTDFVLVESAIKPLYQDAANFTAVHDFMSAQGFHLMDIRAWHRGNNVLVETDLLYRRNGLEGAIDEHSGVDRSYTSAA